MSAPFPPKIIVVVVVVVVFIIADEAGNQKDRDCAKARFVSKPKIASSSSSSSSSSSFMGGKRDLRAAMTPVIFFFDDVVVGEKKRSGGFDGSCCFDGCLCWVLGMSTVLVLGFCMAISPCLLRV